MRSARVATGKAGPVYPEQDPQQERKKLLKTPGNIEPYDLDRAGIWKLPWTPTFTLLSNDRKAYDFLIYPCREKGPGLNKEHDL